MGGMKVSNIDFIRLLPAFMQDDEAAIALSKAVNNLISEPGSRIPSIRTWDEVDNLSEAECDELAWELDVDWYDSTGMSLEEKRNTIKLAQQIKRKRGTKWAVERLISAYFGEGYVVEWYEMGDSPYTFVALTTNTHTDARNFEKFVEAVKAAKNSRSHLVGVFYFWQQGPDPGIEYRLDTSLHRYDFVKCGTRPRIATVGFIVKPGIELEPDETLHRYGFTHAGEFGCGTYPRPGTLGAAVKAGIPADPDVQALRYDFGRKAGTYPRPGTMGQAIQRPIRAEPAAGFLLYPHPKTGDLICGTYPRPGTLGSVLQQRVAAELAAVLYSYQYTKAGTEKCGTYPRISTGGAAMKHRAAAEASLSNYRYGFVECGTVGAGTIGAALSNKATTEPGLSFTAYSFVKCGTRRCGE